MFRLLRCQLSIDKVARWERAERLDVWTVPVTGSEEWRRSWIPRYLWRGMALVVDLGIPRALTEQYLIQTNRMYLYGPRCVPYVTSTSHQAGNVEANLIDFETVTRSSRYQLCNNLWPSWIMLHNIRTLPAFSRRLPDAVVASLSKKKNATLRVA